MRINPVIAVMNGIGSFARFKDAIGKRNEVLSNNIGEMISRRGIPLWEYPWRWEKGGVFNGPERRMRRFIRNHAHHPSDLLCVGFSHGAADIAQRVLPWCHKRGILQQYRTVEVILIDCNWADKVFGIPLPIPKNRNDETVVLPSSVDICHYFWQDGVLGGAQIEIEGGTTSSRQIDGVKHGQMDEIPEVIGHVEGRIEAYSSA